MIVGLTSGCFDLLHYSHLLYLERCRNLCDKLIVGIDSDDMVRTAKGPTRPIIAENERFDLINNLAIVSAAFILRDLEQLNTVVGAFGVHKMFKHEKFLGIDRIYGVGDGGAELVIVPDIPNMVSTTEIINRVIDRFG